MPTKQEKGVTSIYYPRGQGMSIDSMILLLREDFGYAES